MEQKHYIDIERVKEGTELSPSNMGGFSVGDLVVIQCKMDGSNAAITKDENGKLAAFSRKRALNAEQTLNGFWNYAQSLNPGAFNKRFVVFGEWLVKHTVQYKPEAYKRWYVFDIWDREQQRWMSQEYVTDWCLRFDFASVRTWYKGPFISWDHVRSYLSYVNLALEQEEGVVIKNQSSLNSENTRMPFMLKLVNDSFGETKIKNHIRKVEDPQKLASKAHAEECAEMVVTERRVKKVLMSLIDEGELPGTIEAKDMGKVAKLLPKAVYADCVKEEPEIVENGGEYFGKACNHKTMVYAKQLILGGKT